MPSIKKKTVNRRTFLGCITCRNRKVKCDGRRPKCLRCEKSNRECLGYGFKLKFTDPMTIEEDGSLCVLVTENKNPEDAKLTKRQQLGFMKFPNSETYTTFDEVDQKLEELEVKTMTNDGITVGPFGKYQKQKKSNLSTTILSDVMKSTIFGENRHIGAHEDGMENNLPPILQPSHNNDNTQLTPIDTSKLIPLVPALELHYQRQKHQSKRDKITNSNTGFYDVTDANFHAPDREKDNIVPKPIWIHPRLEIDAILTYQTLMGSIDAPTTSWEFMKSIIFAEKYNTSTKIRNRIIDKMELEQSEANRVVKKYIAEVERGLNDGGSSIIGYSSFTSLLKSHRVQELVRLFVKSQPNILILTFHGCILDTLVIPMLYKTVGELMIFECSVGLPGDWSGKVADDGIDFRDYCDILKRTFCMVALSITSFSQYKELLNRYGIYDGSLNLFRCYIAFREMSLVYLAILIKPLIDNSSHLKIKVNNELLIDRLLKNGLLKELILTFILAIYQDSNVDIIINYPLLYSTLEGIKEYCEKLNVVDKDINGLCEWFHYIYVFYRSCSEIDLANYIIDDEGFEDVNIDYNLIKKFDFDDHFEKNEYNKIEIQVEDTPKSFSGDDEEIENSSNDEEDEGSNVDIELPKRILKRPEIVDKPPKSFTVHFHFSNDDTGENTIYSDSEIDDASTSGEVDNHPRLTDNKDDNDTYEESQLELENSHSSQINLKNKSEKEEFKNTLNKLTGFGTSKHLNMYVDKLEQLTSAEKQMKIPNLSSNQWERYQYRPTNIELSFGLPKTLLVLIERSIKLADHKNWCLRKKIFPRNFPKICCDLEDDILNWKLDWDLYSTENGIQKFHSLFHETLYHLCVSFYNTTLVFFLRLIKETDPNMLQNNIVSTINHLESLRNISVRSDFLNDLKLAPPFWCFFISGSDAISPKLRYRYDELARKTFIAGNKWVGKQIMMEVWKSNTSEQSLDDIAFETSWLDMIKDWKVSGFN